MTCKCDMRTKLVGDGCSECNPELYKEMLMDEIEELQQENNELAAQLDYWKEQATLLSANVERLREALKAMNGYLNYVPSLDMTVDKLLEETPAQSLNHIKAQIAERQCSELAAQVEEETVGRCAEIAKVTYEGADYSEPTPIDFYGQCSARAIKTMPRKYSNQPETAAKEDE